MIRVKVHAEGAVLDHDLPLDRISDTLAMQDSLLWVDVIAPTVDDLGVIEQEFGFHQLAR